VCDSAYDGWPKSLADAVADNLSFGAHVLGQCVTADSLSLDDLPVALKLNGEQVGSGNTGSSMGNPLDAALWLVNQMVAAGQSLRAGDVIMTGALAGMQPVAAGDLAEVEMGALGSLSCRVSG
ncbi:MAG TPA: 2-keto-4-pentenoate hydratase, partial [Pseudomonas sp.]|nr:2-keto-4-pentenoate hydratase [Pseudomonas sp.]